MAYLLILTFIPVFFVGIVIYLTTLYTYAFKGDLDVVLLLIGLFGTIISSFVVLKTFALLAFKDFKLIKLQKKVDAVIGLFSFTLLFLFGLSLIISTMNTSINVGKLIVGIGLVVFYLYIIYYYFLARSKVIFELLDITKVNDKYYMLSFGNDKLGTKEVYVKNKDNYKKGEFYYCRYSDVFNDITKVLNKNK